MPRSVRSRASRVACFDRDWRRRGTTEPYNSPSVAQTEALAWTSVPE